MINEPLLQTAASTSSHSPLEVVARLREAGGDLSRASKKAEASHRALHDHDLIRSLQDPALAVDEALMMVSALVKAYAFDQEHEKVRGDLLLETVIDHPRWRDKALTDHAAFFSRFETRSMSGQLDAFHYLAARSFRSFRTRRESLESPEEVRSTLRVLETIYGPTRHLSRCVFTAFDGHHAEIARGFVLHYGSAAINAARNVEGLGLLHEMARLDLKGDRTRRLLDLGLDPLVTDSSGIFALEWAVLFQRAPVVRELLNTERHTATHLRMARRQLDKLPAAPGGDVTMMRTLIDSHLAVLEVKRASHSSASSMVSPL